MSTIKVATQAQLSAALNSAKAGDTILLANGNYGKVEFNKDYSDYVTLKAENTGKASLEYASFNGSHGALDGVKVTGGVWGGSTDHVKITNSTITGTVNFRYVDTVVLENNDITTNGQHMGLLLNSVQNFTVRNNTIHDAVEDIMRVTGDSYNGLVENNTLRDVHGKDALHCDLLQFFASNGKTPHDITIRGNLFYDDPNTGTRYAQGIFMSDPGPGGYKNFLIEDNMIASSMTNSIYVNGGQKNVVIRNNTLIPNSGDEGGVIRLATKAGYNNSGTTVENNVFKELYDESKASKISDNVIYGKHNTDDVLQVSGKWGDSFKDFLAKAGSSADNSDMGAYGRLQELMKQAGQTTTPTPTKPVTPPATVEPTKPVKPPVTVEPTKPADGDGDTVYSLDGTKHFNSKPDRIITVAHNEDMAVKQGSIALSFNADVTGWNRGLISKDAAGQSDGISAWISNGVLKVTFENDKGTATIDVPNIKAGVEHDMLLTFGDGKVNVWLDGALRGSKAFDMDMSDNNSPLVVGGYNAGSTSGTNHVRYGFDGTISDVKFIDGIVTQNKDGSLAGVGEATASKQPAPAPAPVADNTAGTTAPQTVHEVFAHDGDRVFSGKIGSALTVEHDAKMELDEGTIAFNFNADTTGWRRGLVSKDSGEEGHEFSSWIQDGKLIVQFQNEDDVIQITKPGIKAHQDYEFMATFDEDHVQVFLDGKLVGEKDFHMDLSENTEDLSIGAVNFSDHGQTNDLRYAFDGHISDVSIYDAALTVEELHQLQDGHAVTHNA